MSSEFDSEPVEGLPERLPAGETMLWQGQPEWRSLALHAFHVRKIAVYFALLIAAQAAISLYNGTPVADTVRSASMLSAIGAAAVATAAFLAWLYARTTVYTITDSRIVMRYGAALPMALNLPFAEISAAAAAIRRDGTADIPLALESRSRVSWLHLWPHVRPWRISKPEPMLRSVPDGVRVARLLANALVEAHGTTQPAVIDRSNARPAAIEQPLQPAAA